jgi:HAD superfamily hydrolase (TIGR01509 family)
MIQAILFDLDGLMVDSEPHSLACWQAVLSLRGVLLEQAVIDRMFGLRQLEAAQMLIQAYSLSDQPLTLAREKEEYQIDHLNGQIKPMPGLFELLDESARLGLRAAVASSGARHYVHAVLQAISLAGHFQTIVTGDDVTNGKPAPDIFLAAARALQVEPQRCLVLEDAPSGVQAAKAAGMRCVAIPNDHTRMLDLSSADLSLPSLMAVCDALADLIAA